MNDSSSGDSLSGRDQDSGFLPVPPFWSQAEGSKLASKRLTISGDAVLSAEQVVEILGGRASVVRRWLQQVPPLRHPTGRRAYLWSDIVAYLKEAA